MESVFNEKKAKVDETVDDLTDTIDLTGADTENHDSNIAITNQQSSLSQSQKFTEFKSSNWIEHFAPQSKDNLAIHAKKVAELDSWFQMIQSPKRTTLAPILLITGPSGSGKTATLNVLSNEYGYDISEWITPVDIEHVRSNQNDENVTFSESQRDQFSHFLFQSSRYRSVFDTSMKRLILVEDFPNTFIRDPSKFEEILQ